MQINPKNIELRDKIVKGVNLAFKKLVISSAEKNEKLVIADMAGNVQLVDAKDLLKNYPETEKV